VIPPLLLMEPLDDDELDEVWLLVEESEINM
jgi:hypothetical protein